MNNKFSKNDSGMNRDIRAAEWEGDNFSVHYTDSTCPFTKVLDQIREPGKDYLFALNHEPRLDEVMNQGWNEVDPSRIANRVRFSKKSPDSEERQCIRVNDTVVFERDERYSKREMELMNRRNADVMLKAISPCQKTTVQDLTNPFGR